MRIGIIGAGHIGGTLAALFVTAGHEVAVSNSRGPDTLGELVAELGATAHAATTADAAAFGDLLVVSVPFGRYRELPADNVAGKIVVDTNNYYPRRDGDFAELDSDRTTSSELLAAHLAGAKVVKAFNAMYWEHLRGRGRPAGDPERLAIPISGDDADAKQTVAGLIDQIGFDAVDAGGLADGGRRQQPGSPAYGVLLTAKELQDHLGD
jgi:predicted dinucleotide-binding enzyme